MINDTKIMTIHINIFPKNKVVNITRQNQIRYELNSYLVCPIGKRNKKLLEVTRLEYEKVNTHERNFFVQLCTSH